ncbi:MAG: hypothetical protein AAFP76_01440 [Bacteroidota bacterium]
MKDVLIYGMSLLAFAAMNAQDYFTVVKKNDNITYHYPESAILTLYDAEGNGRKINKGDAVAVSGDYRVEIDVSWKDKPDVIKSEGGLLEVFVLENTWNGGSEDQRSSGFTTLNSTKSRPKPVLERKEITPSEKLTGRFNALLAFSNDMVFTYRDGEVKVYEDGVLLEVDGVYIAKGKNETLKLSYDPKKGKFWYVFEKNKV